MSLMLPLLHNASVSALEKKPSRSRSRGSVPSRRSRHTRAASIRAASTKPNAPPPPPRGAPDAQLPRWRARAATATSAAAGSAAAAGPRSAISISAGNRRTLRGVLERMSKGQFLIAPSRCLLIRRHDSRQLLQLRRELPVRRHRRGARWGRTAPTRSARRLRAEWT